jgi:hypothetical protein
METIVDTAFDYLIVGKGEHRDDGPRAALVLILAVGEDGWLRPLANSAAQARHWKQHSKLGLIGKASDEDACQYRPPLEE